MGFTPFDYNIRYEENATVVEDVVLSGILKKDLKNNFGKNKNIPLELMNLLTENISEIKEHLLQMVYSLVRKKTAQTIILHYTHTMNRKGEDSIRISRSDLAGIAGIATESLIRTLSEFKKKGFREIEGRNTKILQVKALEEVE